VSPIGHEPESASTPVTGRREIAGKKGVPSTGSPVRGEARGSGSSTSCEVEGTRSENVHRSESRGVRRRA